MFSLSKDMEEYTKEILSPRFCEEKMGEEAEHHSNDSQYYKSGMQKFHRSSTSRGRLLEQQQLLNTRKASGIEAVEIETARQSLSTEHSFVIACLLLFVHDLCDLLPDGVVDSEYHE